jgi:hypothetical protein
MEVDEVIKKLKDVDKRFEELTDKLSSDKEYEFDDSGLEGMLVGMMALSKKSLIYAEFFEVPIEMMPSMNKK